VAFMLGSLLGQLVSDQTRIPTTSPPMAVGSCARLRQPLLAASAVWAFNREEEAFLPRLIEAGELPNRRIFVDALAGDGRHGAALFANHGFR
jgi:hypothetical protein